MLKVYKKESKFNNGEFYYSATRADGTLVNVVFTNAELQIPEEKAFGIQNIKGQQKYKEVQKDGETYRNVTYYVKECQFCDMPTEDLDE